MKKNILFAAILFAGVSVAKAADPIATTTKLSVKLVPLQTITINQSSVELLYDDASKYENGATSNQEDHFKVYSTGGFTVSVNSTDDKLTSVGNELKTIDASTITVQATKGTNSNDLNLTQAAAVPLSKDGKTLFTANKGGVALNFNVDYVGAGTQKYFDKLFNAGTASVFETVVTYSILPN